jgi:hypothetical protein
VVQGLWNEADVSKTKRTGHAARIAALERDVARLRAQLPKEIHHAVRTEVRVAFKEERPFGFHMLGADSYSEKAE